MSAKKASKGKRYSDAEKQEILAYADAQGRGGQSKAAKKYGVSPLSIGNWRKALGKGKPSVQIIDNGSPASTTRKGAASGLDLEIAAAKWLGKNGHPYEIFQSLSSGTIERKTSKGIEALALFSGGDYTVARIGRGGEPVVEISLSKLLELTKTK